MFGIQPRPPSCPTCPYAKNQQQQPQPPQPSSQVRTGPLPSISSASSTATSQRSGTVHFAATPVQSTINNPGQRQVQLRQQAQQQQQQQRLRQHLGKAANVITPGLSRQQRQQQQQHVYPLGGQGSATYLTSLPKSVTQRASVSTYTPPSTQHVTRKQYYGQQQQHQTHLRASVSVAPTLPVTLQPKAQAAAHRVTSPPPVSVPSHHTSPTPHFPALHTSNPPTTTSTLGNSSLTLSTMASASVAHGSALAAAAAAATAPPIIQWRWPLLVQLMNFSNMPVAMNTLDGNLLPMSLSTNSSAASPTALTTAADKGKVNNIPFKIGLFLPKPDELYLPAVQRLAEHCPSEWTWVMYTLPVTESQECQPEHILAALDKAASEECTVVCLPFITGIMKHPSVGRSLLQTKYPFYRVIVSDTEMFPPATTSRHHSVVQYLPPSVWTHPFSIAQHLQQVLV